MPELLPARRLAGLLSLQRSDDGKVAGVCAAVADHWQIDPMLVRVAALVLAISGGIGVVLYATAWLWMRTPSGGAPLIAKALPGAENWSGKKILVVSIIAAVVLMIATSSLLPFGPGPMLVLVAVALIARHARRSSQSAAEAQSRPPLEAHSDQGPMLDASSDFGRAVLAWQQRLSALDEGVSAAPVVSPSPTASAAAVSGATPTFSPFIGAEQPAPTAPIVQRASSVATLDDEGRTRRRRRRRGTSAWVSLATLALAAGAWFLVDWLVPSASIVLTASASLAVIAVALVLTSSRGRPRFLIVPALVLAIVVAQGFSPGGVNQPLEHRVWSSAAQVPTELTLRGESIEVDATNLTLTQDTPLDLSLTGGVVKLDLPDDMAWTVTYSIKGGVLGSSDTHDSAVGWGEGEFSGGPENAPRLHITVTIKGGVVVLE